LNVLSSASLSLNQFRADLVMDSNQFKHKLIKDALF